MCYMLVSVCVASWECGSESSIAVALVMMHTTARVKSQLYRRATVSECRRRVAVPAHSRSSRSAPFRHSVTLCVIASNINIFNRGGPLNLTLNIHNPTRLVLGIIDIKILSLMPYHMTVAKWGWSVAQKYFMLYHKLWRNNLELGNKYSEG